MTKNDRAAMIASWRKLHEDQEWLMDLPPRPSFCRGFFAGLEHAREQAATQLDDRADNLDHLWCSSIAADILRDQAAKIRSGQ